MSSSEAAHSPHTAPESSRPGPPAPSRRPTMFENEDVDYHHVGRDEANDAAQHYDSRVPNGFGTDNHGDGNHGAGNYGGGINGGGINGGGINGGGINSGGINGRGNHDTGAGGPGHGDGQDQNQNDGAGNRGGDGGDGPPDDAAPPPKPNQIELKVVDNSNNVTHFRVKRTTKFAKIFQAYAAKEGKDLRTLRFLYQGERIIDMATPEELEMEDQDSIDVMIEQIGGGDDRESVYKILPLQPIQLTSSEVEAQKMKFDTAFAEYLAEPSHHVRFSEIFARYIARCPTAEDLPDLGILCPGLASSSSEDNELSSAPTARQSKL